jgi:hypothetical protein
MDVLKDVRSRNFGGVKVIWRNPDLTWFSLMMASLSNIWSFDASLFDRKIIFLASLDLALSLTYSVCQSVSHSPLREFKLPEFGSSSRSFQTIQDHTRSYKILQDPSRSYKILHRKRYIFQKPYLII